MRKPRFGLDADGCVYDFDYAAGQTLVELGREHPGPAIEWNHIQHVDPEGWDALWSGPPHKLFRRKDAIVADAKNLVTNLKGLGYEVVLVTSRPANAEGDTLWLAETLGCDGYEMVKAGEKYTVGCDLHLDDSPDEIVSLLEHATPTIIMDRPWNVSVQGELRSGECWVAESYAQVLDIARQHICESTQEIEAVVAEKVAVPIQTPADLRESVTAFSPAVVKLADNAEARGGPCASAIDLVYGDREDAYGHPYDDFSRTAAMATALFSHLLRPGVSFEPEHVGYFMECVKLSREMNSAKPDNSTDGCGYWETIYRIKQERLRRGA